MGSFKVTAGAIVRPLGHPTKMVPTKPGEVQPIGRLVFFDETNRYFKNPATSQTSGNFGVVANTNLNGKYDGQREVVFGHGQEVWVNVIASAAIVPGREVIFSTTVAGQVQTANADGSDNGTAKVVGKMICKASEFWKDGIENAFTNAAANDVVTILLYEPTS
jgi:hypothetical protein